MGSKYDAAASEGPCAAHHPTALAAAFACAGPAFATPTTTAFDVNMLNLLSPFLTLNGTSVGQTTLSANLSEEDRLAWPGGVGVDLHEQVGEEVVAAVHIAHAVD